MFAKPATPLFLLLFSLLLIAGPVVAQDAPPKDEPAADEPIPDPVIDDSKRRQLKPVEKKEKELEGDWKVYVPFKNLKDVFEKEGQGVFVPFEEFLRLWEGNLDRRPVPAKPPVPYLVTRARYEGAIDGDLAALTASIEFETFTDGWAAVPLGFAGIAVGAATLDGKPATLETTAGGYRIHVPEKGAYSLTVEFVVPVAKHEDRRTITFRAPPTPVSRLVFDVPEEGALVTVTPNLATTRTDKGSGVTRVMAFVGSAAEIGLSWRPRPVEVSTGPALLFADCALTATVSEAALRLTSVVDWTIHRAPVSSLALAVPEGVRILFVEGPDLRTWEHKDGKLTLSLHKPAEKAFRVVVTMETDLSSGAATVVPAIRALDVAREQGFVLVTAPPTVKVVPTANGLYRTDFATVKSAPKEMVLAYRYPAHPWSLSLDVTRIRPEITVDLVTRQMLTERSLVSQVRLTYNVKKAAIFTARIRLPADVTVVTVARDVVSDYRIVTEDDARFLVLELKGARIGVFTAAITIQRPLTMGEDPLDIELPLVTPVDVQTVRGLLGVARDAGLKLATKQATALTPIQAAAFGSGVSVAWSFQEAGRSASLSITRREPEVTAMVATTLKAEENRIAVKARITWSVKYAGVDEFSFTLPEALREEIHVEGKNIREKPLGDTEDGRFRQRIVLQGKVVGAYVVTVEYDLPYGEGPVVIPVLVTEGTKREEGVYAVYREPMLSISEDGEKTTSLEAMDPRELPPGIDQRSAFLAFKYLSQPHSLALTVEKHEFLPVLTAAVYQMHLVTLLNEEGTARTEVRMLLRNNGLQFLTVKLEEGAAVDQLEIGMRRGRKVEWKKEIPQAGDDGAILIRIPPEAGPEETFVVRFVYSRKGELPGMIFHDLEFRAPVIEGGEVPVINTTWDVYPPVGVKITHAGGTLAWLSHRGAWYSALVRSAPQLFSSSTPGARARRPGAESVFGTQVRTIAPRRQSPIQFGGRVEDATVEITFANPGTFIALRILIFLGFAVGGMYLLRRAAGGTRLGYVTACVALPLLISPTATVGTAEVLVAVLLGGLVAGLYWVLKCIVEQVPGILSAFTARRVPAPAPVAPIPVAPEEPAAEEAKPEEKKEEQE